MHIGGATAWESDTRITSLGNNEAAISDVCLRRSYMLVAAGNTIRLWDLRK